MLGLIEIAVAYVVAKKMDDLVDYKIPKGKRKNRSNPFVAIH